MSASNDGLSGPEASARLARYGPNALTARRGPGVWAILLRQFTSVLIVILLAAAAVAAAMGETVDAIAIAAIVLLNGVLGFVQEWRAERTLEALRTMLSTEALVVRDGAEKIIDTREIVPGDRVLLRAGEKVPADIRLDDVSALRIDEAVLTGESATVPKEIDATAFMGTSIVEGRASGIVVATAMKTEFGRVAALATSVERTKTHLQKKLGRLGALLGGVALALGAMIVGIGVLVGRDLGEMAMTGLSLAVAIVPEGLPAVVTVTLALGARAMVRRHALSRRLQATETLGAASVICTDKTGTLTENRMMVARVWTPVGAVEVDGEGYSPVGTFTEGGQVPSPAVRQALDAVLRAGVICNHARIERKGEMWERIGEPTEAALVVAAMKAGIEAPAPPTLQREIPFSSDRKRMSVVVERDGETVLYMKGAPERVLAHCAHIAAAGVLTALDEAARTTVENAFEALAGQGYRVLAVAEKGAVDADATDEECENNLTLLGLVGIIDPPRPEVRDAIATARRAGIDVIMITGDAPTTALAIARQLGMDASGFVTGSEIERINDAALAAKLRSGVVFARTAPHHKMRIVELLQRDGRVVAMTGDGVNDAPALRKSDIGIAMGIRGTEVAKDAADIVLLDDNFASIISAIEEGRRQYVNIRKFVRYLLSSNAGEVIAISANLVIGGPLIFLPIQILWMNLVTDGVTALTLGLERAEPGTMQQPPRAAHEDILGWHGLATILAFALYTGGASLFVFYAMLDQGAVFAGTVAFTAMVFLEKFSVFAFRSLTVPTRRIGVFTNPWLLLALASTLGLHVLGVYWPPLQSVLHTVSLPPETWGMIALLIAPVILVPETIKIFRFRDTAGRP